MTMTAGTNRILVTSPVSGKAKESTKTFHIVVDHVFVGWYRVEKYFRSTVDPQLIHTRSTCFPHALPAAAAWRLPDGYL